MLKLFTLALLLALTSGVPREPAGINRRARNTALTMVILAWRLRAAAARRATVIAAQRDGEPRSAAGGSEMLLRGCGGKQATMQECLRSSRGSNSIVLVQALPCGNGTSADRPN